MSNETFAVGDRVAWTGGSKWSHHDEWGIVIHVTPSGSTVIVQPVLGARREAKFRRGKYGFSLRKETDLERRRREWHDARPRGKYAWPSFAFGHSNQFADVSMGAIKTAAEARQASAELHRIAVWLEAEPRV